RYAALLRGVMPTNAKMPELKKAFELAGFTDVVTVLGSGNVVFNAPATKEATLEKKAEAAMQKHLGRSFSTIVRSIESLEKMLASDPYGKFKLKPGSKRVVTFFRVPAAAKLKLPDEIDGARICAIKGTEAFSAYVPGATSPVFMVLIEKTFGKDVTTRTWETVEKIVRK
ncbi:MAG TPA: DUF1697 domain-containing protein, partial [Candidatus Krumholzibacteria bacterium]|nr:DUF1697 domain-containing protein [Candidatus Krumholzibacteria bacterium]